MMTAQTNIQSKVKSALRTLDILELVVAYRTGISAVEISAALSIPESSLSYLLSTLTDRAYLNREGRLYFAGARLDRLREPAEGQSLADRAAPLVKAICGQLNETTSLFMLTGWEAEAVITETSSQNLRYSIDVGTRTPLHCISAGKALLAAMPPDQLESYFTESERLSYTPNTRCDRRDIEEELARVRSGGFARTRDEYSRGISAIGMAVPSDSAVTYAISVAVPTSRYDDEVEGKIIEILRKTTTLLKN
ncbi:hypothetical protein L288_00895 [Sphingobium quisquiliarum P25]|uniref:IclR family transcriptional regulator n=2 Tax=Sphingobium TaxID=165695 RepID=T0HNZ6_9SPHN|nr:IclR family transcriptional regulator C-terminal domain-containing protein [Sphingobium quisquiliarum]EQB14742.1 hypothetical protein L288_00895 [Sphingobium quisquiliarum P25]